MLWKCRYHPPLLLCGLEGPERSIPALKSTRRRTRKLCDCCCCILIILTDSQVKQETVWAQCTSHNSSETHRLSKSFSIEVKSSVCCSCRTRTRCLWGGRTTSLSWWALRTSAAHWGGRLDAAGSSCTFYTSIMEGGVSGRRNTHSPYPLPSLLLFHSLSLSPSHTVFFSKLPASLRPFFFFSLLRSVGLVRTDPAFHLRRPLDTFYSFSHTEYAFMRTNIRIHGWNTPGSSEICACFQRFLTAITIFTANEKLSFLQHCLWC